MSERASESAGPLYRHGDVLVTRVAELPGDVEKLTHLVLAEGEITGHSHRIAEPGSAELLQSPTGMFLHVLWPSATLIHQEHGPIMLGQGVYRVWRQREYSPQEIRTVRH